MTDVFSSLSKLLSLRCFYRASTCARTAVDALVMLIAHFYRQPRRYSLDMRPCMRPPDALITNLISHFTDLLAILQVSYQILYFLYNTFSEKSRGFRHFMNFT